MYRDVKKKLLSVALCICMIIGAVQVVPKVKAEAGTVTISGTNELAVKQDYTVNYINDGFTPFFYAFMQLQHEET